jgi:hypothetical protein
MERLPALRKLKSPQKLLRHPRKRRLLSQWHLLKRRNPFSRTKPQRSCKYPICSRLNPSRIQSHSRRLPLIIRSLTLGVRKMRKHQRQIHGGKRKRLPRKPLSLLKSKRKSL